MAQASCIQGQGLLHIALEWGGVQEASLYKGIAKYLNQLSFSFHFALGKVQNLFTTIKLPPRNKRNSKSFIVHTYNISIKT